MVSCLPLTRVQNPPIFFRSGAERSVGAFLSKKFGAERSGGAEISENFDFLVFLMNFSRIIAQKGPKRSQITPHALAPCLGPF